MKKALLYIYLFALSWVYSVRFNVADWDLWARLSVGKIFSQLGHVLKTDIFSYTQTKPMWVDHEWGSGVVFYNILQHFGDNGIMGFKILVNFLVLVIIAKIVELYNKSPNDNTKPFWYTICYLALFNGLGCTVRCQYFTFLFFTFWIYLLERIRRGDNYLLWIFPAMMLFWANLHGGFIVGAGLLGIYGVGEFLNKKPWKKYFLILIPTLLVTLINPYGINYWTYLIEAWSMPRPFIIEWMSSLDPAFISRWPAYKFLIFSAPLIIAYNFFKERKNWKNLDFVKYILLFATYYLGAKHIKHQALFSIVAMIFLYHDYYEIITLCCNKVKEKLSIIKETLWEKLNTVKDYAFYCTFFAAAGLLIWYNPIFVYVDPLSYPTGSVQFIKDNHIKGNIISAFQWGSYVQWRLYPQCLVAIDGRYEEVYPQDLHLLTQKFLTAKGKDWYEFIEKYPNTDILLVPSNIKILSPLMGTNKWEPIYQDASSTVFIKKEEAKKRKFIKTQYSQTFLNEHKYDNQINFLK